MLQTPIYRVCAMPLGDADVTHSDQVPEPTTDPNYLVISSFAFHTI